METIAHYRILERLGENALGEIFRARDTKLGRTIALTVPGAGLQDDVAKRELLLSDAKQAMTVSHPNLAALYEAGEDSGRVYLAFEFVPGDTLDRVVAGHPLNVRRAIDLTSQIADALAEVHAAELSHGDVTVRKIVVTPKGNAKLLDFGFSRWTSAGSVGSEAADIEAVGVLFFEMLTGRAPATAGAAPSAVNKSLPAEVDALASKPYQSAVALAADLRSVAALLQTRAEAAARSRPIAMRGAPRRSKRPWIAAIGATLAAAAAAAWWWMR